MHFTRGMVWPLVFLTVCHLATESRGDVDDFIEYNHPLVPGRLYVPPEANNEPRPLILFLHGAGETGTNNTSQVNGNIDNLLDEVMERGVFLYAPQAITRNWSDTTRTSTVMSMIDQALTDFNVDMDRLYVTGLSMGGGGVWNMVNRYDDRFAAAVPIAGVAPGGDFDGGNLLGKPTWAFHARNDTTVPSTTSRNVVDDVLSAAAAAALIYPSTNDNFTTLRYTNPQVGLNFSEWSVGGHGIWGPVYDIPEMYDWMFSKTLNTPPPVAPAAGAQVIMNNMNGLFPIGDPQAIAIPSGSGFAAVGTIALTDQEVAQTNAASLATLANSFTQFGSAIPMGVNGIEGLFSANIGAPLSASDPLLDENIYLVVGDGDNIETSSSLFVFKSDEHFSAGNPSTLATIALDGDLGNGDILLGMPGTVFANRLGGFRPGIIAATVPEPSTWGLMMLVGIVLRIMQRRRFWAF